MEQKLSLSVIGVPKAVRPYVRTNIIFPDKNEAMPIGSSYFIGEIDSAVIENVETINLDTLICDVCRRYHYHDLKRGQRHLILKSGLCDNE